MTRAALLLCCLVLPLSAGCSQGVPEKTYEVQMPGPLDRAKQILRQYVNGQPLGSEVTDFPALIAEVKQADPQKGDILEKGLADLQKSPVGLPAKAQALINKL